MGKKKYRARRDDQVIARRMDQFLRDHRVTASHVDDFLQRRLARMYEPATCIFDEAYIDDVMLPKLAAVMMAVTQRPPHEREAELVALREALLDTREPGKDEAEWMADAHIVVMFRDPKTSPPLPPPGSWGATYLKGEARGSAPPIREARKPVASEKQEK